MKALNIQNRTVAVLGNGTWAPMSAKLIEAKISEMKNMTLLTENFAIKSALKETQLGALDELVGKLAGEIVGEA
jgi:flavorubredoxin